jgi:RNA-directed DNA polymerase
VYRPDQRQRLAAALAEAFLQGRWAAEDLADRAARVLKPVPEWLQDMADAAATTEPASALRDRERVARFVEQWLADRAAPPDGSGSPPSVIASMHRTRGGRRVALDGRVIDRGWSIARFGTVGDLAERLELDAGQLAWLADVRGLERTAADERLRNYRYRWVPRRSGLARLIEAPKMRLKEIQRFLLREILEQVPAHDAAHGFTPGRSALTHARLHTARPAVLTLDLRDFFASVTAGRVFGIYRTLGYSPEVAHVLTALCTNVVPLIAWDALPPGGEADGRRFHLGRALATPHLPQGAPSSPALANLAAFGLDRRLSGLAAAFGLRYSRYADDLTLSGPLSGRRSASLSSAVARIAREEGFVLNPRKSRLRTAARRQRVTGIVVNAHPNLARPEYDRLKATLHRLARDGPASGETAALQAHLHGRVSWVESLNSHRGAKLRRLYEEIDWDARGAAGA